MTRTISHLSTALAVGAILVSVTAPAALAAGKHSPDTFTSASCTYGATTTTASFSWKGHADPNAYTASTPDGHRYAASISAAQQAAKSVSDTYSAVDLYGPPGTTITIQLLNTTKNSTLATTTTVCS